MLKTFFAVLYFLILTSCENEKPIVEKQKDLETEKEYFDTSFDWLDTERETDFGFFQDGCFEEAFVEETKKEKAEFTPGEIRKIGRAVAGVIKWKKRQGVWWECGKPYKEKKEIEDLAFLYVVQIFRSAKSVSDESYKVNPWGMLGVIANESRFDRCALGTYPRKKAYSLGILERPKLCVSHTEEEILAAVNHPKMRKYFSQTGFDLGVGQVLSRFHNDEQSYDKQIEMVYGCDGVARELRNRAFWKRTKKGPTKEPWLFWRGSRPTRWYADKIEKWARLFGARKNEI